MKPEDVHLADSLIQDGLHLRRDLLRREVQAVTDHATRASALGAGRYHVAIADVYARELRARGDLIWDTVQRILSTTGIDPNSPETAVDIKQFVLERLTAQWQQLETELVDFLARHNAAGGLAGRLGEAHANARDGLFARIELRLRELRTKQSAPGAGHVQNFYYGQIGAVQTGPASTAQVSVSILVGDVAATTRAIDTLIEAIRFTSEIPTASDAELVETLGEIRAEVAKPTPNRLRLNALAAGIAGAIQTAAALRPAYEVVRTALLAWGVHVPAWP